MLLLDLGSATPWVIGSVSWVLALVIGIPTLLLVWKAHRARKLGEFPTVKLEPVIPSVETWFRVVLETDVHSVGWEIIGVEVAWAQPRREVVCEASSEGGWSKSCTIPLRAGFPQTFEISPDCSEALLLFVCRTPDRVLWSLQRKQTKRVPYRFRRDFLQEMWERAGRGRI